MVEIATTGGVQEDALYDVAVGKVRDEGPLLDAPGPTPGIPAAALSEVCTF